MVLQETVFFSESNNILLMCLSDIYLFLEAGVFSSKQPILND